MDLELREAQAEGVVVEVRDALGHSRGQAVYFNWQGRPLPDAGDAMSSEIVSFNSGQLERVTGIVRSRHFDVQRDADGEVCVWVRIVLEIPAPGARSAARGRTLAVSQN